MSVNVIFKEPEKHGILFTLYMVIMVIAIATINTPGLILYMIKYRGKDPCVGD